MVSKRLALVAAIATLAVAGCAGDTTRSEVAEEETTPPAAETTVSADAPVYVIEPSLEPRSAPKSPPATTDTAPVLTGILVCDDYLSHYQACHRTLKLFDEEQIEQRYIEISSVLANDARNASLRDDVEQRCSALEATMKEQLDGRECDFTAPPLAAEADASSDD